jgi:release factor glutamine methyltransferase
MKNSKALFRDLVNQIKIDENSDEVQSMVYILLENLFSLSRADILTEKEIAPHDSDWTRIREIVHRINLMEPIQYILGETEFYGRNFKVNNSVLIPRPETEELVKLIIEHVGRMDSLGRPCRLLDIGTGSGCIPVTLALELRGAELYATDVSHQALNVARENASRLDAKVQFVINDILQDQIPVGNLNVIVSNPPYIPVREKESIKRNVLAFEPHLALLTPTTIHCFYRVIVEKARDSFLKRPVGC